MTVERVRVGEVLRLERIPVDPDPEREYVTIGIRSFGKGIFHYEPKPGDQLGKLRFFAVRPDRLVVSNIKGWEGALAVSSQADAGYIASNRFLQYVPIDDRIDVRWACWYFLSEGGLDLIQRASPGSADRNRTLAIQRFEDLVIPLPPIDKQLSVANALARVGSGSSRLIELSARAKELLGPLAASIAARPDLDDSWKRWAGWARTQLGAVLTTTADRTWVDPLAHYRNIGIYSFGRGLFEKPDIDGGATSAKLLNRVRSGQFIYSRLFAFEGAYAYVPEQFDGAFVSAEFPTMAPDVDRVDSRWLAAYLSAPARWAELAGASKGLGVRRQRVPVEAVLAYEVWLPPIADQRAMVRSIDRLEAARQAGEHARIRLNSLIPSSLNRAFAGLS